MKFVWMSAVLVPGLMLCSPVAAQSLVPDEDGPMEASDIPVLNPGDEAESEELRVGGEQAAPAPGSDEMFMPDGSFVPITERPTLDGVERGRLAVIEMDEDGNDVDPALSETQIFVYYDNFTIERSPSGRPTCTMRFFVNTNLDRKLVSLAMRLVWPGMTTSLSFENVAPNTPTYFDYALMGEGCYTMDQIPNIVVNRCRVRGMSAAECASKISWLTPVK